MSQARSKDKRTCKRRRSPVLQVESTARGELPPCSHRPPCPGCPLYGRCLSATPGWAQLMELAAQADIELSSMTGPPLGYRHRARLAVRGRPGSPSIGIFAAGSHRVVDIPGCHVHHPAINRVARALWRAMQGHGIAPYREEGHQGRVRYLQVAVARQTGAAQVVVVDRGAAPDTLAALWQALRSELGDDLHSLFWNHQPSPGNAILGRQTVRLHGEPALCERLGGATVHFPPDAFAQANMPLFAEVVERIHGLIPLGARVVEYYAGVGAIGLGLAFGGRKVACNELAEGSLRGLVMGRAALSAPLRERVTIHPGQAGECTDLLSDADTVVVDPPRKGLDPTLLSALCQRPVPQLLYLSCGLPALVRETAALLAAGYRLRMLCAIDLFPNTEHVETLAYFSSGRG